MLFHILDISDTGKLCTHDLFMMWRMTLEDDMENNDQLMSESYWSDLSIPANLHPIIGQRKSGTFSDAFNKDIIAVT